MPINSNNENQRRQNLWRKIRLKAYWRERLFRNHQEFAIIIVGLFVFYVIAVLYLQALDNTYLTLEQRSLFGNVFNGLNTIVSAHAFAVLVYTAFLQRKELGLQREELKATREEFAKQSKEFESQNKLSIISSYYSNLFNLINIHKDVKLSINFPRVINYVINGELRSIDLQYFEGNIFRKTEQINADIIFNLPNLRYLGDAQARESYFSSTDDNEIEHLLLSSIDSFSNITYFYFHNYYLQTAFMYSYVNASAPYNENWQKDLKMFETTMSREEKVCLTYLLIQNRNNFPELEKFRNCTFLVDPPSIMIFRPDEVLLLRFNDKFRDIIKNVLARSQASSREAVSRETPTQ